MGRRAQGRGGKAAWVGHMHGSRAVLRHKSCSGQIRRGGMIGGVHSSVVQKRERVSWAS
jgi:hypothetical protein